MIVRVDKNEFETDDGITHVIPFELNEIPSLEEFRKIYDEWVVIFKDKGFIK